MCGLIKSEFLEQREYSCEQSNSRRKTRVKRSEKEQHNYDNQHIIRQSIYRHFNRVNRKMDSSLVYACKCIYTTVTESIVMIYLKAGLPKYPIACNVATEFRQKWRRLALQFGCGQCDEEIGRRSASLFLAFPTKTMIKPSAERLLGAQRPV